MASQLPPLLPFLRPQRLPTPSTFQSFLPRCFSTTSRCCADARQREDRNLTASRTASPTYPPPSMKSLPRPKESRASRRTAHPPKKRTYPTRQPSHHPPTPQKLIPEPLLSSLAESQCAPNLPYFVTRSKSNELPVYTDFKRGGNLHITLVRKIEGRAEALRDALRGYLGLTGAKGREEGRCVVNPVTRQVVIKGLFKPEVTRFLRERRF